MFEDVPFDVWTLHANPGHFGRRSLKEIRLRTLIGAIENLRNGITTIQDMFTLVPQEEEYLDCVLSAYEEAGIRVVLSLATRDMAALDIAPFMPKDLPESIRRRIEGTDRTARGELDFVSGQIKRLGVNPRRCKPGRSDHLRRNAAHPSCSKGSVRCPANLAFPY